MTAPQTIDLSTGEVADLLEHNLAQAGGFLADNDLDGALDGYVCALGLALQLGPAPMKQVLEAILEAAHCLAQHGDADALSTMGPALVGLVSQVREANALPNTAPMDAWASVASGLGVLISQLGLALALPPEDRSRPYCSARAHAALLDDTTRGLFGLTGWIDEICGATFRPDHADIAEAESTSPRPPGAIQSAT
jgi:hypothetical protein